MSILSLAAELPFVRWLHKKCHKKITEINSGGVIKDQLQDKLSSKNGSTKTVIEGEEVNTALCGCPVYCYPDPPGEIRRRLVVYQEFKKLADNKAAEEKKMEEEKKNSKKNKKKESDNKQKK